MMFFTFCQLNISNVGFIENLRFCQYTSIVIGHNVCRTSLTTRERIISSKVLFQIRPKKINCLVVLHMSPRDRVGRSDFF